MAREIHKPLIQAAVVALNQIFRDQYYADKVLARVLKSERRWGARDRRFLAETVYDITRWWRRLNWTVGHEKVGSAPGAEKSLANPDYETLIAAYLTLHDPEVSAVLGLKATDVEVWQKRWEAADLPAAIRHSLPDWLEERGIKELGAQWPETIHALNRVAPVFLRANRLKGTKESLADTLNEEGIRTENVSGLPDALKLAERKNVFTTASFRRGLFEVQDGGSQQIAPFMNPQPGERVVDACAGAGGKSLHLAALMKNRGRILALDVHSRKLKELRERARRAGADLIEVREIDSTKVVKRLHDSADRVLLDVPCSGSGVWRRNPDSRWKLIEAEIDRLLQLQAAILQDYSVMVKKGGVLVYSTCSLWPSENQNQIREFLESNKEFRLEGELSVSPATSEFDGFYAARLSRTS